MLMSILVPNSTVRPCTVVPSVLASLMPVQAWAAGATASAMAGNNGVHSFIVIAAGARSGVTPIRDWATTY
jgi:hypothetical protein